jgi:hypothetical protein
MMSVAPDGCSMPAIVGAGVAGGGEAGPVEGAGEAGEQAAAIARSSTAADVRRGRRGAPEAGS